jgi:hypothetical protein
MGGRAAALPDERSRLYCCIQRFFTAMYSDPSIGEWEEELLFLVKDLDVSE